MQVPSKRAASISAAVTMVLALSACATPSSAPTEAAPDPTASAEPIETAATFDTADAWCNTAVYEQGGLEEFATTWGIIDQQRSASLLVGEHGTGITCDNGQGMLVIVGNIEDEAASAQAAQEYLDAFGDLPSERLETLGGVDGTFSFIDAGTLIGSTFYGGAADVSIALSYLTSGATPGEEDLLALFDKMTARILELAPAIPTQADAATGAAAVLADLRAACPGILEQYPEEEVIANLSTMKEEYIDLLLGSAAIGDCDDVDMSYPAFTLQPG